MLKDISKIVEVSDENAKIVPGKGSLSNTLELRNYQKVMSRISKQMESMIKNGKTLQVSYFTVLRHIYYY